MWQSWYEQTDSLAQEVGVIPEVPCVTCNIEHDSVKESYQRIVVYLC